MANAISEFMDQAPASKKSAAAKKHLQDALALLKMLERFSNAVLRDEESTAALAANPNMAELKRSKHEWTLGTLKFSMKTHPKVFKDHLKTLNRPK